MVKEEVLGESGGSDGSTPIDTMTDVDRLTLSLMVERRESSGLRLRIARLAMAEAQREAVSIDRELRSLYRDLAEKYSFDEATHEVDLETGKILPKREKKG